jgi:D-3-phosphoglycerate dehydrogenase
VPDYRVLLTAHTARLAKGNHLQQLVDAGCEIVDGPYRRPATEDELIPLLDGIDAALATTDAYTRRVFAAAPRLKVIARTGVGFDSIDLAAAAEHGVWVTTTPGTNEFSVADMALTLILALARQLVPVANHTAAGGWERPLGIELGGRTLGLVGFGRIGRQVAVRARAFGMAVVVYDVFQDERAAAEAGARYVSLDELFASADVVSLHAPATPETRDLICTESIAKMKPGALLVNTARGELVNEMDLAAALREGRLGGAALDVFKREPPGADNPLLGLPNVVATPHVAGVTEDTAERMAALAVQNILAALRGERPPYPVNEPRPRA